LMPQVEDRWGGMASRADGSDLDVTRHLTLGA
jgi:hypothetical protein